jgi:hypothetical protein
MTSVPGFVERAVRPLSIPVGKATATMGAARGRDLTAKRYAGQAANAHKTNPDVSIAQRLESSASTGFRHPITGTHVPGKITPQDVHKHLPLHMKGQGLLERYAGPIESQHPALSPA